MNIVPRKQSIERSVITDREYHALPDLNASGIKKYIEDPIGYYTECILGQKKEEKDSQSVLIGNMCHAIMAEDGSYESTYTISTCPVPTGQMLELVEELYSISKKSMKEEEGQWVQQRQFSDLIDEAIQRVKYDYTGKEVKFLKKDKAKILEMFTETGEKYYQELLRNTGKVVVSIYDMQKAEDICNKLKEHPHTAHIVNKKTEEGIREILTEYIIQWEMNGIKCKIKIDRLEIDHINKKIIPYDYKITWECSIKAFKRNYLKQQYYIPAGWYDEGLDNWKEETELNDYEVEPMKYIVADATNKMDPTVRSLTEYDLIAAWEGFKEDGREYIGISDALAGIQWSIDTGIWTSEKVAHENGGHVPIIIQYQQKQ